MTAITHFDCPSVAQLPADLKGSSTSSCTSTLMLISRFVIETSAPLHRISRLPWKPENILDRFLITSCSLLDWTNHPRYKTWKALDEGKGQKNRLLLVRRQEFIVIVGLLWEEQKVDSWVKSGICCDEWRHESPKMCLFSKNIHPPAAVMQEYAKLRNGQSNNDFNHLVKGAV